MTRQNVTIDSPGKIAAARTVRQTPAEGARPDANAMVTGVCLRYPGKRAILQDVNFELMAASAYYLTGPSGAGKSSLLRALYGDMPVAAGAISLFGQSLERTDRAALAALRRHIGIVFQDSRLLAHLSVFDNIALPLRLAGWAQDTIRPAVFETLDRVGLGHRLQALPETLSGGEQQRVGIARALIVKPWLLLADEPTGNVDESTGDRLMALFHRLHQRGTAVLIATHSERLVRRFPHPRFHLSGGTLHGPLPADADPATVAENAPPGRLGRLVNARNG